MKTCDHCHCKVEKLRELPDSCTCVAYWGCRKVCEQCYWHVRDVHLGEVS